MNLVLVRHGVAVDLNEMRTKAARDDDRPLTKEGRRKVLKTAQALLRLGVRPDLIVHSGLVRARETAEPLAQRLRPRRKELVVTETLRSEADPRQFLRWLSQQKARTVIAVGHAPHLDLLVAQLCGAGERAFTSLGKAGAAAFELETSGRRGKAGASAAQLEWLLTPKLLRQLASR